MTTEPEPPDEVDVAVIGGGPTGVVAANLLGLVGLRTTVLERDVGVHHLPRAAHVDDEILRVFEGLGLPEVVAATTPVPGMQLLDARRRVRIHLREDDRPGPNGYPRSNVFHQPDVETLLRAGLERFDDVTLCEGSEVVGLDIEGDRAELEFLTRAGQARRRLRARVVLGCDGAHSLVRRRLGIGLHGSGFAQRWLVMDTLLERPLPIAVPQQVCDPARPATSVPMGGRRHRWEFLLHDGEGVDELLAPVRLRGLLAPWLGDRPFTVVRAAAYTFHARAATRWRVGPVLLLGDAAHQMPPFLGQGLCAGIRDAANLAWKLQRVLRAGAPTALLDTYETERAAHVRAVTRRAVLAGRCIADRGPLGHGARGLLSAVGRLPLAARRRLGEIGMPGLPAGPLVLRSRFSPGDTAAGSVLPRSAPTTPGGTVPGSLDRLLGSGFAVVGTGDPLAAATPLTRARIERLGARVVRLDEDVANSGDDARVVRTWLADAGATSVLVRPDRYVAAICGGRHRRTLDAAVAAVAHVLGVA